MMGVGVEVQLSVVLIPGADEGDRRQTSGAAPGRRDATCHTRIRRRAVDRCVRRVEELRHVLHGRDAVESQRRWLGSFQIVQRRTEG